MWTYYWPSNQNVDIRTWLTLWLRWQEEKNNDMIPQHYIVRGVGGVKGGWRGGGGGGG